MKSLKNTVIVMLVAVVAFNFLPTVSSNATITGFQESQSQTVTNSSTVIAQMLAAADKGVYDDKPPDVQLGDAMYTPEAGLASGLWGTAVDLARRMELSKYNSNLPRSTCEDLFKYIGTPPKHYSDGKLQLTYDYPDLGIKDKFAGPDGIGVIRYTQNDDGGPWLEDWALTRYNGETLRYGGCGYFATANALSTITRRWVNPAELFIVCATSDVTHGGRGIAAAQSNSSRAALIDALRSACTEAGVSTVQVDSCTQQELDTLLESGGVLVGVFSKRPFNGDGTDGGHWIVIYDKVDCPVNGTCYLMCNSVNSYDRNVKNGGCTHCSTHIAYNTIISHTGFANVFFMYPNPDLIPDSLQDITNPPQSNELDF